MSAIVKEWITCKELSFVARKSSFRGMDPQRVSRLLSSVAELGACKSRDIQEQTTGTDAAKSRRIAEALLQVWKKAKAQAQVDSKRQHKWRMVMASCNTLYQRLTAEAELGKGASSTIAAA